LRLEFRIASAKYLIRDRRFFAIGIYQADETKNVHDK
jgi:hypothetical protein